MTNTITTELRGKMGMLGWYDENGNIVYTTGGEPASEMACLVINSKTFADLCDAIDAVHQKAIHELNGFAEVSVLLPKDADGEVIHVGDVMDGYGKTIEVVELRYGRSGWVLISRDGNGYADTFAFTHHREPTVEDVLREFAVEVCGEPALTIRSGVVEEYAARLRLAGEN